MENTEQAGGTRYSAGKPIACWAPWLGLDYVYDVARTARENPLYITDAEDGADEIELQVESIYQGLRSAMRNPLAEASDGRMMLAHVAYLTLDLLHQDELRHNPAYGHSTVLGSGLPVFGMDAVLDVSVSGAEKYAPLDWVNGQSFTTLLSCGMRHCKKMVAFGANALDAESGHKHAGHLAWNVLAILDFIAQGRAQELDNVTPWRGLSAVTRKQYGLTQRSTAYEILLAKSIDEQHAGQQRQRQVAQQIKYRDAARERDVRDAVSEAMMSLATAAAQVPLGSRVPDVVIGPSLDDLSISTRILGPFDEQVPEMAFIDGLVAAHPDLPHTVLNGVPASAPAEGYGPPKIVR